MKALTQTTTMLLQGLMDPQNVEVWLAFDGRYRPVLISFARRLGLGAADAEDVAQESLARFLRAYRAGQYDRGRGRLSAWIVTIAHHVALDLQQARAHRRAWRGESALLGVAENGTLEEVWDEECRRAIIARALQELRETTRLDERTIRAFELVAFEEKPPSDVAAELAMSLDSVYASKSRCLAQLREIILRLNALYEVA